MQLADMLTELQRVLPPPELTRVIFALRQDSVIWDSLQNEELFIKALKNAGTNPILWSPANLGLLTINHHLSVLDLTKNPLEAIDETLRQHALRIYEDALRKSKAPQGLMEAVLAALALRERRRLTNSWDGLIDELSYEKKVDAGTIMSVWQTTLTCLFGIVPDPEEMVSHLVLELVNQENLLLVSNIILSNPLNAQERFNFFSHAMCNLSISHQLAWLRLLNLQGHNPLVIQLAEAALEKIKEGKTIQKELDIHDIDLKKIFLGACQLQQLAGFYQLSGQSEKALPLLLKSRRAIQQCQAGINLQMIDVSTSGEQMDLAIKSLESVLEPVRNDTFFAREFALMPESGAFPKGLTEQITGDQNNPFVLFNKVWAIYQEGDKEKAQDLAREAVNLLLDYIEKNPGLFKTQFLLNWQPVKLIDWIIELGLSQEALQLAQAFLGLRPADAEILERISRLHESLGNGGKALDFAQVNLLLNIEDPNSHRRMAALWETAGDWQKSYLERQHVIEMIKQPHMADWLAFAQNSMKVNELEQALDASSKVLTGEPKNIKALTIKGKVLSKLGKLDEAAEILSHVTLAEPAEVEPWLLLAELHQRGGDLQRAIETLRSAALSIPDSAEVNFSLAKLSLMMGLNEEAIPFLRKAASLSPESIDVALKLGDTLQAIGQHNEARQSLEKARQKWAFDPELALSYAKVLLILGEREAALTPLEVAIQNGEPCFENYMLYTDALLGGRNLFIIQKNIPDLPHLLNAQQALEKALVISPDTFEARLLLAEVLSAKGSYDLAFKLYQKLIEVQESRLSQWRWRLQAGFGKVALKQKEFETALAVLKEATQEQPDHIELHRLLAEAYQMADLSDEALQVANYVLKTLPDDLANLSWFATTALQLGAEKEALEALETATQLAPKNADLWIQLADLQLKLKERDSVRKTLTCLLNLDELTINHWRRAAYLLLNLGDLVSALSCLEQAAQLDGKCTAELYFEIASIQHKLGDLEASLETVRKALEKDQQEAVLYIFQSDLLTVLNRPQAALASLEHATNIMQERKPDEGGYKGLNLNALEQVLPTSWIETVKNMSGLHFRQANLMRRLGDLTSAYFHAQRAMEISPENLVFQYLTADLAVSLLKYQEASNLLVKSDYSPIPAKKYGAKFQDAYIALQAEVALETGHENEANRLISEGVKISPNNPRILASYVRLLARQGEWKTANEIFGSLWEFSMRNPIDPDPISLEDILDFGLIANNFTSKDLWLAEAALEVLNWEKALQLFERIAQQNPGDARAQARYAYALVVCAENQRLFTEIQAITHSPGAAVLSGANFEKFEKAVLAASRLAGGEETDGLFSRGQLAFHPSPQAVPILDKKTLYSKDVMPVVAALRQLKEFVAALGITTQLEQNTETMLQQALCYLEIDSEKGLYAAQEAVKAKPNQPIVLAVFALLAQKNGQPGKGLEALEHALQLWEDEPLWQANAARMASLVGGLKKCSDHWEKACRLDKLNGEYALELGKVYLELNENQKSIQILKNACQLNPRNVEEKLTLAKAYFQAGMFNESLETAESTVTLNPNSPAILMTCAEAAFVLKKIQIALDYANEAIKIEPNNAEATVFVSKVFESTGKLQEALDIIETSTRDVQSTMGAAFERAKLIKKINGAQAALPVVTELAQHYDENPEILAFLANIQAEMGDYQEAEKSAHASLMLIPEQPELNLLIGRIKRKGGQLDQAIHHLSETVRQAPEKLDAYIELGLTFQERREYLQALQTYEQAIKQVPDDYRPYYSAALIMREIKDYLGAEAMLRRAAELSPQDINIRRQLGAVIALNLVHNSQEAGSYV